MLLRRRLPAYEKCGTHPAGAEDVLDRVCRAGRSNGRRRSTTTRMSSAISFTPQARWVPCCVHLEQFGARLPAAHSSFTFAMMTGSTSIP